jgi:hypothetical protein
MIYKLPKNVSLTRIIHETFYKTMCPLGENEKAKINTKKNCHFVVRFKCLNQNHSQKEFFSWLVDKEIHLTSTKIFHLTSKAATFLPIPVF